MRTIVDTGNFRLILVKLERPFPEDKPEEPQTSSQHEPSQSIEELIEELKKRWGAR